jgi:hypothetical protein
MKILTQLAFGLLLFLLFVFLFDSNAALWLLRIDGFVCMSIQAAPIAPPFVQQLLIYQAILYAGFFAAFLLYRNRIYNSTLLALKGALFFLPKHSSRCFSDTSLYARTLRASRFLSGELSS